MERIDFNDGGASHRELLVNVVYQPAPDVQLDDLDPIEGIEIGEREFEEGPLVPLEVDRNRERQGRVRIETSRVQQLYPQIDVAVRLEPDAVIRMDRMTHVS